MTPTNQIHASMYHHHHHVNNVNEVRTILSGFFEPDSIVSYFRSAPAYSRSNDDIAYGSGKVQWTREKKIILKPGTKQKIETWFRVHLSISLSHTSLPGDAPNRLANKMNQ